MGGGGVRKDPKNLSQSHCSVISKRDHAWYYKKKNINKYREICSSYAILDDYKIEDKLEVNGTEKCACGGIHHILLLEGIDSLAEYWFRNCCRYRGGDF